MHPVGPLPPRVYWLRRVIILVLAVVVLLGLVFLVLRGRSASNATSGDSTSSSSSSAPSMTGVLASTSRSSSAEPTTISPEPEPTPEPSSEVAPSPSEPPAEPSPAVESVESLPTDVVPVEPPPPATTEEPPPPPERQKDAEGRDLCFDDEITLTALAAGPFTAGGQPVIGVRVQNTGPVTCTRDVSASLQVFTVLGADGSHVWSTADCFPGQGTEVRTLTPGETLEYQVKWSGTTSQPGCTGDRVPVPAGSYQLIAAVGGIQSGPTPFEITG